MWRALLARKAALLGLALLIGVGLTALRAGRVPPDGFAPAPTEGEAFGPDAVRNVAALVRDRHGLAVEDADLRLVPTADAPLGVGSPAVAWFTAAPEDGPHRDLFALRLRLSSVGIPVVVGSPTNVTRTPAGDELLLDATDRRVLYGTRVGRRFQGVVVLDFGRSWLPADAGRPTRAVAALAARQTYGTWDGPARTDLVLAHPSKALTGQLTAAGLTLALDEGATLDADLDTGTLQPPGAAQLQRGAPPQQEVFGLLADTLRQSAVVGVARVMAVEEVLFRATDWLRRQRHRLFPTAADRLPVAPHVDALAAAGWPPPDLPLGGNKGLPGEGRWVPVEAFAGEDDPPVRRTFLRVDPARPYVRTHLFAFDMARLGLHFVAGTRHPRSTTGARGSGRVADAHRARLVAAFNGGFKTEHGAFGTIEDGRVLVEPQPGLGTVAVDADGRAGFGLWDTAALHAPWVSLRQNLPPLIADGVVNPTRARHWGELVAELDEAQTPRSAVGVTGEGVLIYAWSKATSAERLGEAMKRAGVRFALHLDMNPGHTGVEFYRSDGAGGLAPQAGARAMDYRRGRWLGTDARDFFYLVRAADMPAAVADRTPAWAPGEGIWQTVAETDGVPTVARTFLTPARTGGRGQVRVTLLDGDRLRPHLVPGLAEPRPATGVPLAEVGLEGLPVAWMEVGLRAARSPYGMVAARRTWRPAQPGIPSFAVDEAGASWVGRLGEGPLAALDGWSVVVQGPALLEDGRPAEGARGRSGMPAVGLGRTPAGDLVLASVGDGDRAAMARALEIAGARDGLVLGEQGTATTGTLRRFLRRGDRFFMIDGPAGVPKPAVFAAGAGSALVWTARRAEAGARVLDTFGRAPAVR